MEKFIVIMSEKSTFGWILLIALFISMLNLIFNKPIKIFIYNKKCRAYFDTKRKFKKKDEIYCFIREYFCNKKNHKVDHRLYLNENLNSNLSFDYLGTVTFLLTTLVVITTSDTLKVNNILPILYVIVNLFLITLMIKIGFEVYKMHEKNFYRSSLQILDEVEKSKDYICGMYMINYLLYDSSKIKNK
ncbi:hypothetical protein [Maledivibacter halophilus]|uniref:Uncharacterized protein n=1 Tax=Maledivibacter halophilus TaxID=36842 RepID=A0A1T5KSY2_9FIRM|nr:hypothetical protein [Maledivibacter halophilus]SKC66378.1 hypothetical protein SAMN02194393_02103 [Maledivibacter halophilus]